MKILITGAWNCGTEQREMIELLGYDTVFMSDEQGELPCAPEIIEGTICNGLFLHHSIEKFSSLRYIQLTSAGFDRVPMEYVRSHGIKINNAAGVYSIPMAEFAVNGVLQIYKQSAFFYKNQKDRVWQKHRGVMELYGKTVCIVGCGNVGTECAKRFQAFGCNVIGVDLFTRTDEYYEIIKPLSELDNCLSCADVVILTLPLTNDTLYLMNSGRFQAMKDGSILVNVARGAIVEETSLSEALDKKLQGAVLDVFEEEPLSSNNVLWNKHNVIITPHNSFVGDGNASRLQQVIYKNLTDWIAGEK